jgi:hypothetical protein
MSTWQDLGDLLEMYRSGGLVIMTGMDGVVQETAVSPPTSSYDGKIYTHTGIRTTIQFDSDYVTVMTPAVLQQPHVWQQHVTHVNAKLAVLDKLRQWAQRSWLLFLLIPLAWAGYDLRGITSWQELWSLIYPTLMSAAIVIGRKWVLRFLQVTVLPLITRAVSWFVRRKFKQFVGDMQ